MIDPVDLARSFTTAELAKRLDGRLDGPGELVVTGVNALSDAGANEITFITSARYAQAWAGAGAGAAVVSAGVHPAGHDATRRALITVPNAELALAELLTLFAPPPVRPPPGVHPTACVDPEARLADDVCVGPAATIGAGCTLGRGVVVHAGVHLYPGVEVGAGTELHAGAVVRERVRLGARVTVHSNASIGGDGFGYRPAADGSGLVKMPHLGTVVIEDDVEIGAGVCIDRAKFGATVIGRGTKLDNLVQVAHNCRIGRHCLIAGQVGLAGSVTVEDGAMIGGASALVDHSTVGAGARLGGGSHTIGDVPAGETWLGMPAAPALQTLREWAALRKLVRSRTSRIAKDARPRSGPTSGEATG